MNQLLREKEKNNLLLQKELQALTQGTSLEAIQEFEQLLKAIPQAEKEVVQHGSVQNLGGRGKNQKPPRPKGAAAADKGNTLLNPMPFAQNVARNTGLSQAERLLVNLRAQDYDALKMVESFNRLKGITDLKQDELYNFKM